MEFMFCLSNPFPLFNNRMVMMVSIAKKRIKITKKFIFSTRFGFAADTMDRPIKKDPPIFTEVISKKVIPT